MVRAEEKLFNVISALTDEYNNYPHKRLKKSEVQNLVHDLEVVDAEFHDLKMPPITDDIQLDNKVCLFYIINELKDIITEPNVEDVEKRLTDFHNTLVFNLGVNALHNHKNDWEDR
jgi:hypothetical protein